MSSMARNWTRLAVGATAVVLGALFLLVTATRPPGAAPPETAPLPTPVPLPTIVRAVGPYSVVIQPLAADPNGIVVSTTITDPALMEGETNLVIGLVDPAKTNDLRPPLMPPRLVTSDGINLPLSDRLYSSAAVHEIQTFDAGSLPQPGARLAFSYTVGAAIFDAHDTTTSVAVPSLTVTFPITFDARERVADVQQTEGVVTLDRVVVTAAQVRAFFHADPAQVSVAAPGRVTLRVGGRSLNEWPVADFRHGVTVTGTHWIAAWMVSWLDALGPWTLTADDCILLGGSPRRQEPGGPYEFTFDVPAVGKGAAVDTPWARPFPDTPTAVLPTPGRTIAPAPLPTGEPPAPVPSLGPTRLPVPSP